ncbi:MAG: phosphopyruvate hydratase [Candidatus Diapherotrites archaeon]|uniref:Enolase n=1 Tax=Candidatus Iainarchaeum sp. TaxID=3101447 RepID=A0A8T4KWM5_9ARCH|nr:phosphopyruvate hydratase [Candidatus Diapherotrites archaeon]
MQMPSSKILSIKARQVFDSRGNPTVEAVVHTADGMFNAIVPSGASTGKYEALELRDRGKAFHGLGVQKAVNNVNKIIAKKLVGKDCTKQKEIDSALIKLDGTANKSKLGANAILPVSIACCKAAASAQGMPLHKYISKIAKTRSKLPAPLINVINGGKHARDFLDFQEYMFMPSAGKFSERLRMGVEIFHELEMEIQQRYGRNTTNVGDEGGFAPPIKPAGKPFELIESSAKKLGYAGKIKLALDAAANSFWRQGYYVLEQRRYSPNALLAYYEKLANEFSLFSIEDPFHENAWDEFAALTKSIGRKTLVVGDDLLVTNPARIKKAVELKACNALLLKPNQIGTITEAMDAARLAKKAKWEVIVSHRSGETEDSFIADFCVGLGTGYCKFGGLSRSERLSKYNQLLRISEKL